MDDNNRSYIFLECFRSDLLTPFNNYLMIRPLKTPGEGGLWDVWGKQQEQPVSTVLFISGYSCTNNETAGKNKSLKEAK